MMTELIAITAKIEITWDKLKKAEGAANSVDISYFRSLLLELQKEKNLLLSGAGDFILIPYFDSMLIILQHTGALSIWPM